MASPIRLGLVGTGNIGRVHTKTLERNGIMYAAAADIRFDVAKGFAKEFDIPKVFASGQELFDTDLVDAVTLAVPNKAHAELAIAAMKAGKDVFVEKPMSVSQELCAQMVKTARETGRILQVGFVYRYSPIAQTIQAFRQAGRFGTIYHAKANLYRRRGIPGLGGAFTTKAESGGGALIDIGVHTIDLATFLMGLPTPVRASGKTYGYFGRRMKDYLYEGDMWAGPPKYDGTFDVDDSAHALIRFEGGATLEVNVTWAGNIPDNTLRNDMVLLGDQAGAVFKIGGDELTIACEQDGHNVDLKPTLKPGNMWDGQLKAFLHAVETREQPHANGLSGQRVQAILDGIYASSAADREVEIKLLG